jgi:multidrug transporter EmrE-like cation transporter
VKLLLYILPTIILTSYSQLITKWRVGMMAEAQADASKFERLFHYLTDPIILSTYVCSLLSSIAWLYVVEKYAVSIAFPTYVGVLFAVVTVGSALLLKEAISIQHLLGIALILVGVVVVSRAA